MQFVIHKTSRAPAAASYSGPTWDAADLRDIYQETYDDLAHAEWIAAKLSQHNPVGFAVSEVE